MADKTGAARLRQAIENQQDLGNGDLRLTYHDAEEIAGEIDAERSRLRREVFGEHAGDVHYCECLGIRVNYLDSPQNPSSAAARCTNYEKGGRNGR